MLNKMIEPIELYIHIPFCVRKCLYCDFLSFPCQKKKQDAYVEALLKEIAFYHTSQPVRSVFIGGGTPSLLEGPTISLIMKTVFEHYQLQKDPEITIEANPGTVTQEKADCWIQAGINRVSMGVQSFDNALLKRIGRIHTAEEAAESFKILRQAGFTNLSMDLMMGLPDQSLENWEKTLETAVSFHPEHLSCYSLIVEEGTPFEQEENEGTLLLPSDEEERAMYHRTCTYLKAHGYNQYEISNFARPGFQSVHNCGYWERVPYLGFGLGAASLWRDENGEIRRTNTKDLDTYINGNWIDEETKLTEKDAQEEFMFLGLRKTVGVSVQQFKEAFGTEIDKIYGKAICSDLEKGLLCRENGRLFLSSKGLDLGNIVFASFLQDDEKTD